ncbi:MAG: helix-turn-helix domain-containing protein [Christensenellaceae bacterium]|jgi:carbohydrate diacid regulator|nr:helix-turn-helix domain-containing protein [Christensenellaceae bacterium]
MMNLTRESYFLNKIQMDQIVHTLMQVLPDSYVSYISRDGIVLASGDPARVGTLHYGALQCIASEKILEVHEDTDLLRRGVNAPVLFNDYPIGVISISGDPATVSKFILLAKMLAELLIRQQYTMLVKQDESQTLGEFIREWLHKDTTEEYTEGFINRGLSLNTDVRKPYCVILIEEIENIAEAHEHLKIMMDQIDRRLRLDSHSFVLMPHYIDTLEEKLQYIMKYIPGKIGVGLESLPVSKSYEQARAALRLGRALAPNKRVHFYKDYQFAHILSEHQSKEMITLIESLEENSHGMNLVDTFQTYVECNGEVTNTAQKLYIHRNTLKYRLNKIFEMTGKDPLNFTDSFYLYMAVVLYKLKISSQSL